MKLTELLATTQPLYPTPHNWNTTLEYMLSHPIEKKTVDILVEILSTKGELRDKIILDKVEFSDGNFSLGVIDGTHRVCAHMILKSDEVNVKFRDENDLEDEENYISLSTEITLLTDIGEDNECKIYDVLRSFPLNDDVWLTASVASQTSNVIHFMWDTNNIPVLSVIDNKVISLLQENNFDTNKMIVKTIID
jgi:hypothetical protein